jgi:hypothetical protein
MALVILVKIALEYRHYLSEAARANLLERLLSQRGPFDDAQLVKSIHGVYPAPESENHITMIYISRYLTNQLLGLDNNGMPEFLLRGAQREDRPRAFRGLQGFLQNDFEEYNARPYQRLTVRAITLLADHAKDEDVKVLAAMVLDYLTAKFAVSSNALRRHVPFRRLNEKTYVDGLFDSSADEEQPRFLALTGLCKLWTVGDRNFSSLGDAGTPVVLSGYRLPLAMINLMMVNEGKEYYQRFHHDGVEIFSSTPEFLISAGGIWQEAALDHGPLGLFAGGDDSLPMPTVVMPSETGVKVSDLVRINGAGFRGSEPDPHHEWGIAGGIGGAAAGATTGGSLFGAPGALVGGFGGGVVGFFGGSRIDKANDTSDAKKRINTGVAPGFACGLNVMVPDYLWSARDVRQPRTGRWPVGALSVIDCTTLPRPERWYVAIRRDPTEDGDTAGWVAAVPASTMTFDNFARNIMAGGGSFVVAPNGLQRLNARPIPDVRFIAEGDPDDRFRWPIRGTHNEWIDVRSWPLAIGDVLNSKDKTGVIHIDHPWLRALDRRRLIELSVRTEFGRRGIPSDTSVRAALHVITGAASGSVTDALLGKGVKAARLISAPLSLRNEMGRRSIAMTAGLRSALHGITGMPPDGLTSLRTALTLLRRRTTLDGPGHRQIGPHYTAREVALLAGADPTRGLRQLFAYQRGLAEICLSELVDHPGGRYTVREACRILGADPSLGLLRLFPAQRANRVDAYRLSSLLTPG